MNQNLTEILIDIFSEFKKQTQNEIKKELADSSVSNNSNISANYNSGWVTIKSNSTITLKHSLGKNAFFIFNEKTEDGSIIQFTDSSNEDLQITFDEQEIKIKCTSFGRSNIDLRIYGFKI